MNAILDAYARWVDRQDEQLQRETTSPTMWLASSGVVVLLSGVAAFVPRLRDGFDVSFGPSVAAFAPAIFQSMLWRHWRRTHERPFAAIDWISPLADVLLVSFWPAFMLATARGTGSLVFGLLFLGAVLQYAFIHRSGMREPFVSVLALGAGLMAWPFCRAGNEALLLATTLTAAMLGLTVGTLGATQFDGLRERERLRTALQAREVRDREQVVDRVTTTLLAVLGLNHDASNALTAALLGADDLVARIGDGAVATSDDTAPIVAGLRRDLGRLGGLLRAIREAGRSASALPLGAASLGPALRSAGAFGTRGGALRVSFDVSDDVSVLVPGGESGLRRVLDNIVLNARQGDGRRGARLLTVSGRSAGAMFHLVFEDDGPGFPDEWLAAPFEWFRTSKVDGTGIGLATCRCLLRAAGGDIAVSNAAGGGARVTLMLPRADIEGAAASG